MKTHSRASNDAFTLVEIFVSIAIFSVVGLIAYSILMSSATLLAKNVSLNGSNLTLRSAVDRLYSELNQANGLPKLINTDGTDASATGPAAGIIFDKYLGGPYLVTNPGTGLPASTQTFQLLRSRDPLAFPPTPKMNDVVRIDIGTSRPVVSTCTEGAVPPDPNTPQALQVTLQAPLGVGIPWTSPMQQAAHLLHRQAFVVVPSNGRGELRFYKDAETVTDYNDPSGYVVFTREISKVQASDEAEPFSIVTQGGVPFLKIAMLVEDQQFNKRLKTQQAQEFNTFFRVDTMVRPRNFL